MLSPQSLIEKQEFIDYLNEFIGIIDEVKEDLITKRIDANNMNHGEERDEILFWLNCIEDGSNSLGSTLEKYDKRDIVRAITCLMFDLHFSSNKQEVVHEIYS